VRYTPYMLAGVKQIRARKKIYGAVNFLQIKVSAVLGESGPAAVGELGGLPVHMIGKRNVNIVLSKTLWFRNNASNF